MKNHLLPLLITLILCQIAAFAQSERNEHLYDNLLYLGAPKSQGINFDRITTDQGLSNNAVQYIFPFADGRMAVVTWRYINIIEGAKVATYPRDDSATMPLPYHLSNYEAACDDDERVWVKEFGQLWCLDLRKGKIEKDVPTALKSAAHSDALNPSEVKNVFFEDNKLRFVLTDTGLWDVERKLMLPLPVEAKNVGSVRVYNPISLLFFDTQGGVAAIDRTSGDVVFQSQCDGAEYDSEITTFRVLRRADKFFRLMGHKHYCRIDVFDAMDIDWSSLAKSDMIIHSLHQTPDGDIIATTRHGILAFPALPSCVNFGKDAGKPTTVSSDGQVSFFREFAAGGTIMQDVSVSSIAKDWQGGLWVGTNNSGILYSHPQRNIARSSYCCRNLGVSEADSLKCHNRYRSISNGRRQKANDSICDSKGRNWLAAHDGIRLTDNGRTRHITTADGLLSDYVLSLVEDYNGIVWAMTNKGVNSIVALDSALTIASFNENFGVPHWDLLRSSAILLNDGRIAVKCSQGWFAFSPDSMKMQQERMRPRLADIYINDRPLTATDTIEGIILPATPRYVDKLTLDHKHNDVTLVFTVPNYLFPSGTDYRWRIVKNGDESAPWHDGRGCIDGDGMLSLNLIELDPASYIIMVKDGSDAEDNLICSFELVISPPWWLTWYAYLIYALIALLILYLSIMAYIRYQKRQMEQRQKEEMLLMRIQNLMGEVKLSAPDEAAAGLAPSAAADGLGDCSSDSSEVDSEFVQRAITFVEQHLQDTYTVEQLAADMRMERTGLYKRLTALIRQSPQAFIRSIKLNFAASLLRKGVSVSEVAHRAGFNSSSHFSRSFSKEFGFPPSEYVARSDEKI